MADIFDDDEDATFGRRKNERAYIPARVTLPGAPEGIGRVRDASHAGLQLELTRPLPDNASTVEIVGRTSIISLVNLQKRWERVGPQHRHLIGARTQTDIADFVQRELRAYAALDENNVTGGLDRETLIGVAKNELAGASEMMRAFMLRYAQEASAPRADFLWGWVLNALTLTEVPGVNPTFRSTAQTAKFLGVMLDVLVDDIADSGTAPQIVLRANEAVFRNGPVDETLGPFAAEIRLAKEVWETICALVSTLPHYDTFQDFFIYDYRQLENALHYASVLNRAPYAANATENTVYQCHNMHMIISGMIDLMAHTNVDLDEVGVLRELFYYGQLMGRIGNAVTTWTREVGQRDFSSAFFATLAEGASYPLMALADLNLEALQGLERVVGAERRLLDRWVTYRRRARETANRAYSVAGHDYVDGLEALLQMHMASRGLK